MAAIAYYQNHLIVEVQEEKKGIQVEVTFVFLFISISTKRSQEKLQEQMKGDQGGKAQTISDAISYTIFLH